MTKLKKLLREAAMLLFWAVVIVALLALMVAKGCADLGYRWGPGT